MAWEGIEEAKAKIDAMIETVRRDTPGAVDSVMGKLVRQTQTALSQGQHAPQTWTGSIAPAPPWRISGKLRRSVKKDHAVRVGPDKWSGRAGPTAIYARIQELGGTINAKGGGQLHWIIEGAHYTARSVYLPARPYLKPSWRIVKITTPRQFAKVWRASVTSALK